MSATITYTELRDALKKRLIEFYTGRGMAITGDNGVPDEINLLTDHILDMPELDRKVQGYSPDSYEEQDNE